MSNLFMRLFSQHPLISEEEYLFMAAFMDGPESLMIKSPATSQHTPPLADKEQYYQMPFDKMQAFYEATEREGKIPLVKEHIVHISNPHLDHTSEARRGLPLPSIKTTDLTKVNPTVLPDSIVDRFAPIILIRHPARCLPSYLRASQSFSLEVSDPHCATVMNLKTSRLMFDYYRSLYSENGDNEKVWPIVIDGDDLVRNTRGVVEKLCKAIGIDESQVKYEWERGVADRGPIDAVFRERILNSTCVIQNEKLLKDPDLGDEVKSWEQEFGEARAAKMKELVEDAMEDYTYLLQFRMY